MFICRQMWKCNVCESIFVSFLAFALCSCGLSRAHARIQVQNTDTHTHTHYTHTEREQEWERAILWDRQRKGERRRDVGRDRSRDWEYEIENERKWNKSNEQLKIFEYIQPIKIGRENFSGKVFIYGITFFVVAVFINGRSFQVSKRRLRPVLFDLKS